MNVFALVLGILNGLIVLGDYHYGSIDGGTILSAILCGALIVLGMVAYDREED